MAFDSAIQLESPQCGIGTELWNSIPILFYSIPDTNTVMHSIHIHFCKYNNHSNSSMHFSSNALAANNKVVYYDDIVLANQWLILAS